MHDSTKLSLKLVVHPGFDTPFRSTSLMHRRKSRIASLIVELRAIIPLDFVTASMIEITESD